MVRFLSSIQKHLTNNEFNSVFLGIKRVIRIQMSSQLPSILIVDCTYPVVRCLSPSKYERLNSPHKFHNPNFWDEKERLGCNCPLSSRVFRLSVVLSLWSDTCLPLKINHNQSSIFFRLGETFKPFTVTPF